MFGTGHFKLVNLLILLVGLCNINNVHAQETKDESVAFIDKFMEAVVAHKSSKTIRFCSKTYKKEQLRDFLKNNKRQFLDELFGGIDTKGQWQQIRFDQINHLELVEIKESGFAYFEVQFKISTDKTEVFSTLGLTKEIKRRKVKYGIEGARG